MSIGFRLSALTMALVAVVACSGNQTAPEGPAGMDRLVGVWHVVSATTDGSTLQYPEANTYWHFKSDGEYCREVITGFGYRTWSCGVVTPGLVLVDLYPSGGVRISQLELSEDGDSLGSVIIESYGSTGRFVDRYDLERAAGRELIDCDCE